MKVVVITQARMTSTRLPGKIMKPVADRSLLSWHLTRLKKATLVDEIIVAITNKPTDDLLVNEIENHQLNFFRGSEGDVLDRYVNALAAVSADILVRVTSDCPLIDPGVIDECIQLQRSTGADYVSNTLTRTYPRGLDVEVFKADALRQAATEAKDPVHREHVTPYIWSQPERFSQSLLINDTDYSDERWTVDTLQDLELITHLLSKLRYKTDFDWHDILEVLNNNPLWREVNAQIQQKNI